MKNEWVHKLLSGFVFVFSMIVYYMTMAPTVSFWDCGEFIACSYTMGIPHPPGAPLYLLVGRIFTLLPLFEDIAMRVNFISVLSSAASVFFLYLIIVQVISEFYKKTEGFSAYIPYLGGVIGSLTFAFTNSFWFNAVEAEVYAPSMFFTSLVVWLIFRWSTRHQEIGNEKYLLLIAYIIGLATGVHLLNVLALPMVVMIVFYRRYELNLKNFILMVIVGAGLTGLVYPVTIMGVPKVAEMGGFAGLIFLILLLVVGLVLALQSRHPLASLLISSLLLIIIGYSSYLTIYIRSGLDPNIDENDPETIERFISYLKREQYGEHTLDREKVWRESPNGKRYSSAWDFFWRYQINKMYIRYFLWNFMGKSANEHDVDPSKFLGLPLLMGLLGAYYHFRRDWKYGLAVFALFFMTGLAIVLYLNQPDPQPRERDYSYVGSFFAFSIWIGIGAAAVLEWLQNKVGKQSPIIPGLVTLILFILLPLQVLAKNYREQNRTGNYLPWDYSYNMLINVEQNGVLYTNGDNDTFPLWYLQEVEKIRQDVRVANLSLLNTDWYILQLKNKEPKVPISLPDDQIRNIMPVYWPEKKTIKIDVPSEYREKEFEEVKRVFPEYRGKPEGPMRFELGPKFANQFLRVQDFMVLNILFANRFQKPLYFGVTVSQDNMLDGLRRYLRMDGLVMKITTLPNWSIHPEILYDMLMNKFKYRNLDNPNVYYDYIHRGLIQNYRAAFSQLASYYITHGDTVRFKEVIQKVFKVMPPEVIPYNTPLMKKILEGYGFIAGVRPLDRMNLQNFTHEELRSIGEIAMQAKQWSIARLAFQRLLEDNPKYPRVRAYLEGIAYMSGEKPLDSLSVKNYPPPQLQAIGELAAQNRYWKIARVAFEAVLSQMPGNPRIKGYLVDVYKELGEIDKSIQILEEWLEKNPNDKTARKRLEEYKKLKRQQKKRS
ncbi:MAG: DUF2723 domain-containing protein [Calditrichaeota bacterium]|nr:DUF2723 domain-containing protein [Calditrichota bacterium]